MGFLLAGKARNKFFLFRGVLPLWKPYHHCCNDLNPKTNLALEISFHRVLKYRAIPQFAATGCLSGYRNNSGNWNRAHSHLAWTFTLNSITSLMLLIYHFAPGISIGLRNEMITYDHLRNEMIRCDQSSFYNNHSKAMDIWAKKNKKMHEWEMGSNKLKTHWK